MASGLWGSSLAVYVQRTTSKDSCEDGVKAADVVKACEASLKRLGRPIDLYQIHFPNVWSNAEYWDGLAMAFDK